MLHIDITLIHYRNQSICASIIRDCIYIFSHHLFQKVVWNIYRSIRIQAATLSLSLSISMKFTRFHDNGTWRIFLLLASQSVNTLTAQLAPSADDEWKNIPKIPTIVYNSLSLDWPWNRPIHWNKYQQA